MIIEKPFVKSFISQRCIGYNKDCSIVYYEAYAIMSDGTRATVYSQSLNDTPCLDWVKQRPYVARDAKGSLT